MNIHQATKDDIAKIHELNAYSYGFDAVSSKEPYYKRLEVFFDEYYFVENENKYLAHARITPLEQNIRGKILRMGAVGNVASDPETRRKGFVRELMHYSLKKMYEDKMGVSTLYPFKDTFYASFGYVNISANQRLIINPKTLSLWAHLPTGYYVKKLPPSEGHKYYKDIHSKAVIKIHGGVRRLEKRWKEFELTRSWFAIAFNAAGVAEGVIKYRIKGFSVGFEWAEEGTFVVEEMYTLTVKAKHALYNFLYLHSDQINKLYIPIYPEESELFPWLQGYYMIKNDMENINMARILDVKNAFQSLQVSNDGQVKVKVIDQLCPHNNQTFEFIGQNQKLIVNALGDKKSDIEITIQGLTALLYGALNIFEIEQFTWLTSSNLKSKDLLCNWFPTKKYILTEEF